MRAKETREEKRRRLPCVVKKGIVFQFSFYHTLTYALQPITPVLWNDVATGDAKGEAHALEQLHGGHCFLISDLAAAGTRSLLKSFYANGRHEALHARHLGGKSFVEMRAVGEDWGSVIRVTFAQDAHVRFACQRLSAAENDQICAKLLGLANHAVHFSSVRFSIPPYSDARQPEPWRLQALVESIRTARNIAAVVRVVFKLPGSADHASVDDEVSKEPHAPAHFGIEVLHQLIPVVRPDWKWFLDHFRFIAHAAACVMLDEPVTEFQFFSKSLSG